MQSKTFFGCDRFREIESRPVDALTDGPQVLIDQVLKG